MKIKNQNAALLTSLIINLSIAAILLTPQYSAAQNTEALYSKLTRSVVTVNALNTAGRIVSQGSGVIISQRTVATNCHVLDLRTNITISIDKRILQAKLLRGNWDWDACILETNETLGDAVKIVDSRNLPRIGQRVVALGSPKGMTNTLSDGLVSGFRSWKDGHELIQTTAPISPGSSGGGLFNLRGELIGITSLTLSSGQNINFAIPSLMLERLPESAIDYGIENIESIEQRVVELLGLERHEDARAVTTATLKMAPKTRTIEFLDALTYRNPDDQVVALLRLSDAATDVVAPAYGFATLNALVRAAIAGNKKYEDVLQGDFGRDIRRFSKSFEDKLFREKLTHIPLWQLYALRDLKYAAPKNEWHAREEYFSQLHQSALNDYPKSCYLREQAQFTRLMENTIETRLIKNILTDCPENPWLLQEMLLRINQQPDPDTTLMVSLARRLGEISPKRWAAISAAIKSEMVKKSGAAGALAASSAMAGN